MRAMPFRFGLKTFCAATLLAAPLVWAEEIKLTPEALEKSAMLSLQTGDPARALAYADALIARNPRDLSPHLLRARALRDMGRFDEALRSARQGWRLADNDAQKYAAALILAQVLSSDDKKSRAQIWLRRAAHHAPTPQLRARAQRDFGYVRQQNPWSTQLSFTLAPNSNINNGSARETSQLNYVYSELLFGEPVEFVLGGAARALSGLEYGASLRSRYRFKQTETTAHDLFLTLSYRSFILSSSAQDMAPDVSGDDFAYGVLGVGYGHRRRNMEGRGELSFDADVGQTFYGGSRYASFVRGSVSQRYTLKSGDRLRFSALAEAQNGQRTSDSDRLEVSANLSRRLATGDNLFFETSLTGQRSPNPDAEYEEIELRAGYARGKPVMGAGLSFGLGAAYRNYDLSRHDPAGREDFRIFADMTATFHDIDYYGFNPTVTLSASSTDSNIGLFDVNRFGISFGVRSAF